MQNIFTVINWAVLILLFKVDERPSGTASFDK